MRRIAQSRHFGGAPLTQDRYLLRAVHEELRAWGRWTEERGTFNGFPSATITETFIGSKGGALPGHRVLMVDAPPAIGITDRRVNRLDELLRNVLKTWYVTTMKPDGTLWSFEEKRRKLGLDAKILRELVYLAKLKFAQIVLDNIDIVVRPH